MTKARALELLQAEWDFVKEVFDENPTEDENAKSYRAGYFQALINIANAISIEKE